LFGHHEMYHAGLITIPKYYPSGTRLHLLDHGRIERLEVASLDLSKFVKEVGKFIANGH